MDYNDVQLDGPAHDIMPLEPLCDKDSRNVVRPAGFEPTTLGFGNQYSIQLSYGRTGRKYSKTAPCCPCLRAGNRYNLGLLTPLEEHRHEHA